MSERLRILARQAWARAQLGHDPVECIHRVLLIATTDQPVPGFIDTLSPQLRDAAMVMLGAGVVTPSYLAKQLALGKRCAQERCRSLVHRGYAERTEHGRYRLVVPGVSRPAAPGPYEQIVQWARFRVITPTWLCERQRCGMSTACSRLSILTKRGLLRRITKGQYQRPKKEIA